MRRIKEETATLALRMLILRKHILIPLRERVQRRLELRRGVRILEQTLLQRGLRAWRQYRAALVAAESAKAAAALLSSANQEVGQRTSREGPPALDLSSLRSDATAAAGGENCQPHHGLISRNIRLFALSSIPVHGRASRHHLALHLGNGLYSIDIAGSSFSTGAQSFSGTLKEQEPLQLKSMSVAPLAKRRHIEDQRPDRSSSVQLVGIGGSGTPTPRGDSGKRPALVSIAKHPSHVNVFVAIDSGAQLLQFFVPICKGCGAEEGQETMIHSPAPGFLPSVGEPSASLPTLASRAPLHTKASPQQADFASGSASSTATNCKPTLLCNTELHPGAGWPSSHEVGADSCDPTSFLPKAPIPPSRWLPQALLSLITKQPWQQERDASSPRQTTVQPLGVSFASPLRADHALVVCLIQGSSSNSSSISSLGNFFVVLVDLIEGGCRGWLTLSVAANSISSCARRHPRHFQQLWAATASGPSSHSISSCRATAVSPNARCQPNIADSRSNILSTVQLQPLCGDLWAVTGPSLLAVFSLNLRFLHHPADVGLGHGHASEPPLHLLWNSASIPVNSFRRPLAAGAPIAAPSRPSRSVPAASVHPGFPIRTSFDMTCA